MAEQQAEDAGKSKKKSFDIMLILHIVFAVVNVGVMGYGTYLIYASTLGWQAPQIDEAQLAEQHAKELQSTESHLGPLIYTMDKFVVNLAGDPLRDPKRTIQLEVNLEMLNKEGFEEVINGDNQAKARDKIIEILGNKSFSELENIQGKLFLKDQIATALNGILDKGVVKDIYFTNFVVQ